LARVSWRDIDIKGLANLPGTKFWPSLPLFDLRDLTDNLPAQVFQVPVDVGMGAAAGIGESLSLLEQPI